ncbi:hypothetical protein C8R44DRAFT_60412 [Mycena epipterygia]|nr:hypothetical protein C8R44DRAFT_60412 [Mycena epipterygia]
MHRLQVGRIVARSQLLRSGGPGRLGRFPISHKKLTHLTLGLRDIASVTNALHDLPKTHRFPLKYRTYTETASPRLTNAERDRLIYKDWYTTSSPLPARYSCEWLGWHGLSFFLPQTAFGEDDERSDCDVILRDGFGIPGTIVPVAYLRGALDNNFLFVADGMYYYYYPGETYVYRYDQETYADPLDLIWRVAGKENLKATVLHVPLQVLIDWWGT